MNQYTIVRFDYPYNCNLVEFAKKICNRPDVFDYDNMAVKIPVTANHISELPLEINDVVAVEPANDDDYCGDYFFVETPEKIVDIYNEGSKLLNDFYFRSFTFVISAILLPNTHGDELIAARAAEKDTIQ